MIHRALPSLQSCPIPLFPTSSNPCSGSSQEHPENLWVAHGSHPCLLLFPCACASACWLDSTDPSVHICVQVQRLHRFPNNQDQPPVSSSTGDGSFVSEGQSRLPYAKSDPCCVNTIWDPLLAFAPARKSESNASRGGRHANISLWYNVTLDYGQKNIGNYNLWLSKERLTSLLCFAGFFFFLG